MVCVCVPSIVPIVAVVYLNYLPSKKMTVKQAVSKAAVFLGIIGLALNAYIYTYPSLNPENCSWYRPTPEFQDPIKAQLIAIPWVGDLINTYYYKQFENYSNGFEEIKLLAVGDPQINGNWPTTPYMKRLDNYGNDYYLGHIYQVMKNRLHPTHVSVMGDLFSSQWIGDSEFYNRTRRYLTRLYPQPEDHTKAVFEVLDKHQDLDWQGYIDQIKGVSMDEAFDYHFEDTYEWTNSSVKNFTGEPLFINITGNHDVGYSGDATWQHMTRYHRLFGKDNFYIEYNKGTEHAYRIVVLNTLFLEGPALQPEFVEYTHHFLQKLKAREFEGSTILLTHIPFYKKEGLCVDGPKHDFYNEETSKREPYKLGKLRSQNHISYEMTQEVLDIIFGSTDKPGIILTGHDHEGCYNVYDKDLQSGVWEASPVKTHDSSKANNYIQEVTVRAVMGDYDGNIGLMTGNFDKEAGQWDFHYSACPFIVQHVWWATKAVSIIELFLISFLVVA